MNYNPLNWYWSVGGSTTQVWSSARCEYVALADATYVAWLAAGNSPTKIADIPSLIGVMQSQWLPQYMAANPVAVTSTGTPALNGTYAVDPATVQQMLTISQAAHLPSGSFPGGWAESNNTPHTFTLTQFDTLIAAIIAYANTIVNALDTNIAGGGPNALPTPAVTIA
jgi:hypothetical protein